jgi:hypothetical protein
MLQSPPFRSSPQCRELLRYIVLRSLDGEDESLRERVIGVEVFGRPPDYDQSSDPVVRIRAADVRKRIALYYDQPGVDGSPIRVSVPPGSYRASFEVVGEVQPLKEPPGSTEGHQAVAPSPGSTAGPLAPPVEIQQETGHPRRLYSRLGPTFFYVFAILAILAILAIATWVHLTRNTPLRRFWAPVLQSQQHALIYAGGNTMYGFATDFVDRYMHDNHLGHEAGRNQTLVVHLDPDQTLKGSDIVRLANTFVSVGDADTAARVAAFFAAEKKAYEMRFDQDISVSDLRQQPTVLIGAYNNDWTMELTSTMRFTFVPGLRIQDRDVPSHSWQPKPDLTDDFALVSRVLDSKTGQTVITAAGLGQAGTSAAGQFLTDSEAMRKFISNAPRGWERKNLQIVLHTTVINGSPSAAEVVDSAYW